AGRLAAGHAHDGPAPRGAHAQRPDLLRDRSREVPQPRGLQQADRPRVRLRRWRGPRERQHGWRRLPEQEQDRVMAEAKTYDYVIRDRAGKLVKGRIEAGSESAVAAKLKSMGVAPLSINEVRNTGLQREIKIPGFGDGVKLKDLAIMAR